MRAIERLVAHWRRFARATDAAPAPAVRTPLDGWSDEALDTLLATLPPGGRAGYFAYHPAQRAIEDLAGVYVTVIARADGTFDRTAGNHGRSDPGRSCTRADILAEIATGRGRADAYLDRPAAPARD